MSRRAAAAAFVATALVAACTQSAQDPDSSGPTAPGTPAIAAPAVPAPAPWWSDEVFYEVFVRSYADSDGDGIGDLPGLVDRLDHIVDLGATALWLMPVMQSPSYHGYDATDYRTVEQDYGTNEDFAALVAAAHERGLEVIVDLMLNHTSTEHPWFVDSASGPDSAKRDWYLWSPDDPGTTAPWGAPAWHERGGAYYFGLFWEGMPDLNYANQDVTAEMFDVARFWLTDMGADGFRLDAVRHLIEDGDVVDGTPATHDWLRAWDDHIDSVDPDALTVGEVWDDTGRVAPYVIDEEVDLAFEFTLAEALIRSVSTGSPGAFVDQLQRTLGAFPPGQFAPFLTNHDQPRVMTQFGGADLGGTEKSTLAASMLLTLPGVPFLYYGEEIGMEGTKPDELIRTPMQWDATEHAGFSTATPWQPVNRDFATVNVAAQKDDPESLLNRYRNLLQARAEHPALSTGGLQLLASSCPSVIAWLRSSADGSDHVLVVHNLDSDEASGCSLAVGSSALAPGTYGARDLISGDSAADLSADAGGAVAGYVPVPSLGARQSLVLPLLP